MGTIVCQSCESTVGHFEDNKVTTLYGQCPGCGPEKKDKKK